MNNSVTDPSLHVYACISSPQDYNNNSPIAFEALARKSKTYTDNFLKTLTTIFSDANTPPVSRFYTLYLLAKASELKNDFLMTRMIKSRALLDKIFKDCQFDGVKPIEEKGKKFFSPAPTAGEAILGNNYIRLLLECFAFWNQVYGTDVSNNPLYAYRIMYTTLLEKIKFPETLYFFNNSTRVSDDFHHLPGGSGGSPQKQTLPTGNSPQKLTESPPTKSVNQSGNQLSPQKPTQRSVDQTEEKNPVIIKTRDGLEQLNHNKNAFRECLENNKDENDMAELVDYLYNDVANTYNSQVYPNVDPLIASGGPSSEKYVTQIFAEGDLVNQLTAEYTYYKKGKTPYREFRGRVVPLLRPQPTSNAVGSSRSTKQEFVTPGNPDEFAQAQEFNQPPVVQEFTKEHIEPEPEVNKRAVAQRIQENIETQQVVTEVEPEHEQEFERRFETHESLVNEQPAIEKQQNQEFFRQEPVVPTGENGKKIVIPEVSVEKIHSPIENQNLESPIKTQSPQKLVVVEETITTTTITNNIPQTESVMIGKPPRGLTTSTAENLNPIQPNPIKTDFRYKSVDTLEDSRGARSSYQMSPYREGERDSADIDRSGRVTSLKSYSLRNYTPGRTDRDGEDLSRSMKISRIKPNDLSMIESSIRQSFVSTGKKPPSFKPLTELQVKEEYDKEINKLKAEKDALQKENAILNNDLKEALAKTYRSQGGEDGNQVEQLRQLLGQHQQRIEALQEEIVNLQNENLKLTKSNAQWEQFDPSNESLRGFQENIRLTERVRELEAEIALLRGGVPPQGDLKTGHQKIETVPTLHSNKDVTLSYSYDNTAPLRTGAYDSVQSQQSQNQAMKFEPAKHLEKVYEVHGQESPVPDSSLAQTPYDINWAGGNNPQPLTSADSSFYDPEWAATAQIQFDKTLTAQLEQQKQHQQNFTAAAFEEDLAVEGREIDPHNQIYSDLRNKIRGAPFTNELKHLKVSCLKSKCPLFENEFIRVGISSSVVHDTNHHKNMLKMVVYFENKCNQVIEAFSSELASTRGLNKVAKPSRLEAILEPGKQIKQQVVTAFDKVPFECLQLNIQVQTAQSGLNNYTVFLPTLISRFMDFKPVNAELFRQKWRAKDAHVLKTEEIIVDSSIVKTAYDFKKFFGSLVDLKPMDENDYVHGAKGIKLGGIFDLDVPEAEYLLKINILPSQRVVFQVAAYETEHNNVTFLLQALTFLFKKV